MKWVARETAVPWGMSRDYLSIWNLRFSWQWQGTNILPVVNTKHNIWNVFFGKASCKSTSSICNCCCQCFILCQKKEQLIYDTCGKKIVRLALDAWYSKLRGCITKISKHWKLCRQHFLAVRNKMFFFCGGSAACMFSLNRVAHVEQKLNWSLSWKYFLWFLINRHLNGNPILVTCTNIWSLLIHR
jgi:hypothetical protein